MGEVDHIRSESSGRPHVHFQTYKVTNVTKALSRLGQPEEFEMYKPSFYLELLQSFTAVSLKLLRNLRQYVVDCLCPVVYCFGYIDAHERRLEERVPVLITDSIIRIYVSGDKLLHDIIKAGSLFKECFEIFIVLDLEGGVSSDTDVRLCEYRISACLINKSACCFDGRYMMLACRRDSRGLVYRLHGCLAPPQSKLIRHYSRCDIEILPELCIQLKPVFIIGFDPVDASVFEREKGDGTVNLAVVFERVDFVILSQRVFNSFAE